MDILNEFIYIAVFLAILTLTCCSYSLKQYVVNNNILFFYLATFLYFILAYLYSHLYMHGDVSNIYTIINISAIIFINIVGIIIFNENCNMNIIIGLIFGIISIYFLTLK